VLGLNHTLEVKDAIHRELAALAGYDPGAARPGARDGAAVHAVFRDRLWPGHGHVTPGALAVMLPPIRAEARSLPIWDSCSSVRTPPRAMSQHRLRVRHGERSHFETSGSHRITARRVRQRCSPLGCPLAGAEPHLTPRSHEAVNGGVFLQLLWHAVCFSYASRWEALVPLCLLINVIERFWPVGAWLQPCV
jgi:hypothetical protein